MRSQEFECDMIKIFLKQKETLIALGASTILAIVFGIKSPLHPWVGGDAGTDSSVFKTVAFMMERGYLPYKDSFDHKGPFLYLVNWLGNRISEYRGIWVIEVVVLATTLFVMYRISRLMCGRVSSVITVLSAVSLLFIYYEGGNLTEEYAMPFIAISIYIFIDYLLNNNVSRLRLIIAGCGLGIILMLRPNMISVWAVYCITITLLLFAKKDFKKWLYFAYWFVAGMLLVLIPVVIWLAVNNDLKFCIQDYIVFNLKYTSQEGGQALFPAKVVSFITFFSTPIYIIAFFSVVFHLCREKAIVNVSYLIYLLSSVVLMAMSGMSYGHYGMILIPSVVYPISLIFYDIENLSDKSISKLSLMIISLYMLSTCIMPDWCSLVSNMAEMYETKDRHHFENETIQITNLIDNITEESDAISVYGNWDIIYVLSKRTHATRYSYQFPVGVIVPEIMDKYMSELNKETPKVIVVQSGYFDERIQRLLKDNNYQMCYEGKTDSEGNSSKVFIIE